MDDWLWIIARFKTARTIAQALENYPSKSVIVFVQHGRMHNFMHWLCDNYDVNKVVKARNTVILDDGREIVFMAHYRQSWGYQRDKFVAVNYL